MTIRKIEDLEAWKEARKLAQMIFNVLNLLPESEKYNLKKHLWECARNTPGNIAEGFGRYHYQESMQLTNNVYSYFLLTPYLTKST